MSKNQMHGKKFEDIIKAGFCGSSDNDRSYLSDWDIESKFDKIYNIPTNIKTTGSDIVCLSDARNFWKINRSFRLLVGKYEQNGNVKIFYSIREFVVLDKHFNLLRGTLDYDRVVQFHEKIRKIPNGKSGFEASRNWVREEKEILNGISGILKLNPKISSSGSQRRLQCSLSMNDLGSICDPIIYTGFYMGIGLPLKIESSQRERIKKKNSENKAEEDLILKIKTCQKRIEYFKRISSGNV